MATFFLSDVCKVTVEAIQPSSELTDADNALKQAFAAALEAEQAGADVTGLLGRLSDGANILAQGEVAHRVGDFSLALEKAEDVLAIASRVKSEAARAEVVASVNDNVEVLSAITIGFVAELFFLFVMFLIWTRFRRNYVKKLRHCKPEVTQR